MTTFKQVFGYYPRSVGSWFIDAHTLQYLYTKFKIEASCNCKDQYGTDGYTLWGGYWNQAYYPSKINSYMPAQHADKQIPVPIFRMLGSDPVRQYDQGLGNERQGVITLEPVYPAAGGDSAWVHWYFDQMTSGESLEYAYTQAGQENSFTWAAMRKGLGIQLPLIARLRDQHKLRVETLGASGRWFTAHYATTPATSVTINDDLPGSSKKTAWFNSRFYRINLLWQDSALRIRDIHLFNEDLPSPYLTQKATADACAFFTLPFVDGYLWSTAQKLAGLRLLTLQGGKALPLHIGAPTVGSTVPGTLHITYPLPAADSLTLDLSEKQLTLEMHGKTDNWFLDLTTAAGVPLPFAKISSAKVECAAQGMKYTIAARAGTFSLPGGETIFRLSPAGNRIVLDLSDLNTLK